MVLHVQRVKLDLRHGEFKVPRNFGRFKGFL